MTKNHDLIGKYKIKISILVPQNGEVGVSPEKGYRSISTPQILGPGTVDTLFYTKDPRDEKSVADIIAQSFLDFNFRGTCLTLEEFNKVHDFHFEQAPEDFDIDYLINFCEYIFNFISHLQDAGFFRSFDKHGG